MSKYRRGKMIFARETCEPHDAPTLQDFWQARFSKKLCLKDALANEDRGDTFLYHMPEGLTVVIAYDGEYVYETEVIHA